MTGLRRRLRPLVLALAGVLLLTGCDFSVYSLPLPGGADVGDDPIRVHVKFRDVLDLVPHSTVKVDDVTVGKVADVTLDGYVADVTLELRRDTQLPDNTVATIRQTSLLGEKFVSLAPPPSGAQGELGDGDVIGLDRSGRNPEVEEVLGALSLVLNGGGVAQLKTITSELNKVLEGREGTAKSLLTQIDQLMGQLDENKGDIVRALEAVNRLKVEVEKQLPAIDQALEELPSALRTIDRQRKDLVRMLQALQELSDVGVRVIEASKDATIASLRQLEPVLSQFAKSGDDFANAFSVFLTYPFVDEVVGRDPQVARNLHMGDYTNLSVTLDLDLGGLDLPTELPTQLPTELPTELPTITLPTDLPTDLPVTPTEIVDDVLECLESGDLTSDECAEVLADAEALASLIEECKKDKNKDKDVCEQLNALPTVAPTGTGLPLPSITLPGLPGLGRAGFGELDYGPRGPTVAQLMDHFDPGLVSLMVPTLMPPRDVQREARAGKDAR